MHTLFVLFLEPETDDNFVPPPNPVGSQKENEVTVRFGNPFDESNIDVVAYSVIVSHENNIPDDVGF